MRDIDFIISEIDTVFLDINGTVESDFSYSIFKDEAKSLVLSNQYSPLVIEEIRNQESQAIIDYFYYNKQKKYYFRHFVFASLRDNFQHDKIKPFCYRDEWCKVINILKKLYQKNLYDYALKNPSRESILASILKGSYIGKYKFKYKDGKVILDKMKLIRCAKEIETLIIKIGPLEILLYFFQFLAIKSYDKNLHRYKFFRKYFNYGEDPVPFVPINYLIQLCMKNLSKKEKRCKYTERAFKRLIGLSKDFLYLYDLYEFFPINALLFPHKYNKYLLYQNLLYNNIFSFNQGGSNNIIRMLKPLLMCDQNLFKEKMNCSYDFYFSFIEKVYSESNKNGPTIFRKSFFSEQELKLLSKISHIGNVNSSYLLPTDFNKSQNPYYKKPFIDLGDKIFLADKSYSFWNFYECIFSQMNYKIDVGKNFESLLIKYLQNKNFIVHFGKYIDPNNKECDIVIEEDNAIIFCELKKKTITQKSLGGDQMQILIDLEEALLSSSEQLLYHELFLRENKQMRFINRTASNSILNYDNKKIIRISISLFDLQIFNNHQVAMVLFDYLRHKKFYIKENDYQNCMYKKMKKKIDIINSKIDSVNSYIEKLRNKFDINIKEHNFDLQFLSLELFLFFIDKAYNDKKTLNEILSIIRNASSNSGNVYFEYDYLNSIINSTE